MEELNMEQMDEWFGGLLAYWFVILCIAEVYITAKMEVGIAIKVLLGILAIPTSLVVASALILALAAIVSKVKR